MALKSMLIPATFGCAAAFVAPQTGLRGVPAAVQEVAELPAPAAAPSAASTFAATATIAGAAVAVGGAFVMPHVPRLDLSKVANFQDVETPRDDPTPVAQTGLAPAYNCRSHVDPWPRAPLLVGLDDESYALERAQRAQAQVLPFLRRNCFRHVDSPRRLFRTQYPLHVAVRQNDAPTVRQLLSAGARPERTDSKGRTALALAEKLNSAGSHTSVLMALRKAPARSRLPCAPEPAPPPMLKRLTRLATFMLA
mmetsp:Transcript_7008/g.20665  ORF Transcript_7008/g.20665 Transcript_7008/m.20665 type:complete len:252 (-) Transcript_7008:100-855(-)